MEWRNEEFDFGGVNHLATGARVLTAAAQRVVRLGGGEPLVDQPDRDGREASGQIRRELPGASRGDALPAGQRRGQPDDDLDRAFTDGQPGQFGPGLRGLRTRARRQHGQRGGQNAARVAASDSDPDRTHIHCEPHPLPEPKLTHREGLGAGPGWTRPGTEDPGRSQEHANTLPTRPDSVPRCLAKPHEPRQMPHLSRRDR